MGAYILSSTDLCDWFSLGVCVGGGQIKLPAAEIAATLDAFRLRHLSELKEVRGGGKEMVGCGWEGAYGFRSPLGWDASGDDKDEDYSDALVVDGSYVSVLYT